MAVVEQVREIIGGDTEALAELERLMDAAGGDLSPEEVLEAAKEEASPLHRHFEWDDSVAAVQWRKHQARALIRSYQLHIIDAGGERRIRYYTNVVVADEHRYKRTEEVLRIDTLREQRRLKVLRELNRVRAELVTYDEFAQAVAGVDSAISALGGASPDGAAAG